MKRLPKWWPTALFFAVLLSMPLWITDGYVLQLIFRVVIFAVVGMAWNIIGGYAGQLSLGHVAYFGIGAYAMTLSTERIGWNPWLGVILGAILAAIGALIIGSITFRLRGPYFALSTIAAADAWWATYHGSLVVGSSAAWKAGEPLYLMLDAYNNGQLCAPHRD